MGSAGQRLRRPARGTVRRLLPRLGLPAARTAACLSLAAGLVSATVFTATGYLLSPQVSASRYLVRWNPILGRLGAFDGSVTSVTMDGQTLPDGWVADTLSVQTTLRRDHEFHIAARGGTSPERTAALLLITDEAYQEILLIGAHDNDLVYRLRVPGSLLGLEVGALRIRNALTSIGPGSELELRARRRGAGVTLQLNGHDHARLGMTVGDGWRLLAPSFAAHVGLHPLLDAGWVAAWLLPLGFWRRPRWPSSLAWLLAAGAGLAVPLLFPLLPVTPLELAAGAGGFLAGAALRARAARRRHPFAGEGVSASSGAAPRPTHPGRFGLTGAWRRPL